jgi:hypothetical protein
MLQDRGSTAYTALAVTGRTSPATRLLPTSFVSTRSSGPVAPAEALRKVGVDGRAARGMLPFKEILKPRAD